MNNVDETNEFARELYGYIGGFVTSTRTVCQVLAGWVNVVFMNGSKRRLIIGLLCRKAKVEEWPATNSFRTV